MLRTLLKDSILGWSNLEKTLLEEANLEGALLGHSKMQWAILQGANLQKASWYCAKMQDVNLRGAYLCEANVVRTELTGAVLPDGKPFTEDMDIGELPRFVNPEHSDFQRTLNDVKTRRQELGIED